MNFFVLTLAAILAGGAIASDDFRMEMVSFDPETNPLTVPLFVRVGLIGFDGQGGRHYKIDSEEFHVNILRALPRHQPSIISTGEKVGINYQFTYDVVHVSNDLAGELQSTIANAMTWNGAFHQDQRISTAQKAYDVKAEEVEPIFDKMYREIYHDLGYDPTEEDHEGPPPYSVLLVNLDKDWVREKLKDRGEELSSDDFIYRYRYFGGSPTQVWISSSRYVVIDVSAGPCTYGRLETGDGTVTEERLPRLSQVLHGLGSKGFHDIDERIAQGHVEYQGKLSAVVVDTVRAVFAPDMPHPHFDYDKTLFVPIVVLQDHTLFDPLPPATHEYSIDVDAIEREVKKILLPSQNSLVTTALHVLHEHPRLAMAIARARRSNTETVVSDNGSIVSHATPYIDTKVLMRELEVADDFLVSGLLEGAAHLMTFDEEKLADVKTGGGRVLPVYVLSLMDVAPGTLLDGEDLVVSTPHAVIVLQTRETAVPVPFFDDDGPITVAAIRPTRHIIRGLMEATAHLTGPGTRYVKHSDTTQKDFLWANGHHPFCLWSECMSLSQILSDIARRHAVLARVHSALHAVHEATDEIARFGYEYLYDPTGALLEDDAPGGWNWFDVLPNLTEETDKPNPKKHDRVMDAVSVSVPRRAVESLRKRLAELAVDFMLAAEDLYFFELRDADQRLTQLHRDALGFQKETASTLEELRRELICCTSAHSPL